MKILPSYLKFKCLQNNRTDRLTVDYSAKIFNFYTLFYVIVYGINV